MEQEVLRVFATSPNPLVVTSGEGRGGQGGSTASDLRPALGLGLLGLGLGLGPLGGQAAPSWAQIAQNQNQEGQGGLLLPFLCLIGHYLRR
jgi:hypothetical protein